MAVRHGDRVHERARARIARADHKHRRHAGFTRAGNDQFAVRGKLLAVDMAM
jgi:hypothetical protein